MDAAPLFPQADTATEKLPMDALVIQGGRPLSGRVAISGAKNAALPVMAATLLAPGVHRLRNVPDLRDTRTFAEVLRKLGARVSFDGDLCTIDTSRLDSVEAPYELVKTMRASIYVLGPLLAPGVHRLRNVPEHLYGKPVDMRRSFDGLYALTRQELGEDPMSGSLYAFINRRGTQMKVLYWDRSGFCVWAKRLEEGCFVSDWGRMSTKQMDWTGLKLLLEGIEPRVIKKRYRHATSVMPPV